MTRVDNLGPWPQGYTVQFTRTPSCMLYLHSPGSHAPSIRPACTRRLATTAAASANNMDFSSYLAAETAIILFENNFRIEGPKCCFAKMRQTLWKT